MTDLCEGPATLGTFVRTFFGMNSLMDIKLGLVATKTTTLFTLKGVFTMECPNMPRKKLF